MYVFLFWEPPHFTEHWLGRHEQIYEAQPDFLIVLSLDLCKWAQWVYCGMTRFCFVLMSIFLMARLDSSSLTRLFNYPSRPRPFFFSAHLNQAACVHLYWDQGLVTIIPSHPTDRLKYLLFLSMFNSVRHLVDSHSTLLDQMNQGGVIFAGWESLGVRNRERDGKEGWMLTGGTITGSWFWPKYSDWYKRWRCIE